MINRKFFFDTVRFRLFNGALSPKQVEGITAILDEWETNHWEKDDRFLAYMLATAFHETDKTMQSIEEYGKGKGKAYGKPDKITGKVYYGRCLVQLTWKPNYAKMSPVVGEDLVNHPELALVPKNAVRIMFYGMINGSFTGKKLSNYFIGEKSDWVNARRIINGKDKANLIAAYAKEFYSAISYTT